MRAELKELWRFRELMLSMVEREIKIRYKNSFLGFLWSLVNPLITVLVMTVVFKYLAGNDTPNFSAYILAAYLPFMFFQFAVLDSSQSVLSALPFVRKVYFPRETLPLATIVSNFIHFLLALLVFFAYLMAIWLLNPGVTPFTWNIVFLPILLVINLALATGVGLIVSSLNVFYEDVKYIVAVGLYLMFFLCPIMYFSENVKYTHQLGGATRDWVYFLYHLNPVAMLCTAYRKVLVPLQPVDVKGTMYPALPLDWTMLGITAVMSFAILFLGYRMFNRLKWKFVERP